MIDEKLLLQEPVDLLGVNFDVLAIRREDDSGLDLSDGYHDSRRCRIVISQDDSPRNQPETLFHELLHAIDTALRLELSESQIHALSRGMWSTLASNLELRRYLFARLEDVRRKRTEERAGKPATHNKRRDR